MQNFWAPDFPFVFMSGKAWPPALTGVGQDVKGKGLSVYSFLLVLEEVYGVSSRWLMGGWISAFLINAA